MQMNRMWNFLGSKLRKAGAASVAIAPFRAVASIELVHIISSHLILLPAEK